MDNHSGLLRKYVNYDRKIFFKVLAPGPKNDLTTVVRSFENSITNFQGRHDIQLNDTQQNDTQHNNK
jgi:hypothetical protein